MDDVILNLNETARDAALVKILTKVIVIEHLVAGVYSKLYQLSNQEAEALISKQELETLAKVYSFLGQIAGDANLKNLLNTDRL